jgi:hypothetical protein
MLVISCFYMLVPLINLFSYVNMSRMSCHIFIETMPMLFTEADNYLHREYRLHIEEASIYYIN